MHGTTTTKIVYMKSDPDATDGWYAAYITISVDKTTVVASYKKEYAVNCNYKSCNKYITRTDCIGDLGVILDSKPFSSPCRLNTMYLQCFYELQV
jgi:hypothetical protein